MKTARYSIASLVLAYLIFSSVGCSQKQEAERRAEEREAERRASEAKSRENERLLSEAQFRVEQNRREKKLEAELAAIRQSAAVKSEPEAELEPERKTKPAEPIEKPEPSVIAESSFKRYSDRLFTVRGDTPQGETAHGSGFICEIAGKVVALTNAHVISGLKTISFLKPDGNAVIVAADQLHVALDRDLAFFPLKASHPALKIASGANLDIGDGVVCLGNSQGGSVITDLPGKVLGIGGETIEVDSQFVRGNSGCPLIRTSNGEVIGVATLLARQPANWTNKGTRFDEARRFGTKVEGAKWKQVGWKAFADEAGQLDACRTQREQLQELIGVMTNGALDASGYDNGSVAIRAAVRSFITAATNTKITRAELLKAQAAFLRQVAFEIGKGPSRISPYGGQELVILQELQKKEPEMSGHHKSLLREDLALRKELAPKLSELEKAKIAIAGAAAAPATPARKPTQPQ